MKKIAIFVEGKTELITIREFLLKKFCWQVNLRCLELYGQQLKEVAYKHENPNAEFLYQIVNIGNDKRVLTAILERETSLWKQGFIKLIGLRDMYSKEYRERTSSPKTIDENLNQIFIAETHKVIQRAQIPDNIRLCFSIMEIEAWFLGMYKFLERSNPSYTEEKISKKLEVDISKTDPETIFFQPANELDKVFSISGEHYKKSESDISAILAKLELQDFEELYSSSKCMSFNAFHDELIINA